MLFRPTKAVLSKGATSRSWIARQFGDPYVKKRLADPAAYRSRSAFKLLEIDGQWDKFLSKPDVKAVVDLGAAPGGWSQVVAGKLGWNSDSELTSKVHLGGYGYGEKSRGLIEKKGSWSAPVKDGERFDPLNIDDMVATRASKGRGTIIAVDLLRMQPIHGVHSVVADFLAPETDMLLQGMLSTRDNPEGKVDVILSDMAANASGNDTHDIQSSLEICEAVFSFAKRHLRSAESIGRKRGGVLLVKHFVHPDLQKFRDNHLNPHFHAVKYIKPDSSRSESREGYFLCQGWKGN